MSRRPVRWWMTHVALSMAFGAIIASALVGYFERSYARSAVTILGSGDGLSTLITIDGARILIVAGDDPSEFSNALADARPAQAPRIDLVIVTPGSARVANRAIEITKPDRVLVVESPLFESSAIEWSVPTSIVSTVTTIVIKGHASLELDPGFAVNTANAGWNLRLRTDAGEIIVTERAPRVVPFGVSAIVISGADAGVIVPSEATMLVSSTVPISSSRPVQSIAPGETTRIEL